MITVVTSVTDQKIFEDNLKKSLDEQTSKFKLILADSSLSLSASYNSIGEIDTEYILFIHQDIYLCIEDWLEVAEVICNQLKDLGAGGVAGWNEKGGKTVGCWARYIPNRDKSTKIKFFDKEFIGQIHGGSFTEPQEVQVLDDMVFLVPSKIWKKQKYDAENFPFHCRAYDFCLSLKANHNKKSYVLPLPVYEYSITSWTPEYFKKHGREVDYFPKLAEKWKHKFKRVRGYPLER